MNSACYPMKKTRKAVNNSLEDLPINDLYKDIRTLIVEAQQRATTYVNAELVLLYWKIGSIVQTSVKQGKRSDYGEQLVQQLSLQLSQEFGKGFSKGNLFNMIRFFEAYPEQETVYALSRQLSWTHFRVLIYLKDELQRKFYTE